MNSSTDRFRAYVGKHWLKLGIALVLLVIIIKKDFSFQINLRSPVNLEDPAPAPPSQPVKEKKTEERLTENTEPPVKSSVQTPLTDKFKFPSIGSKSTKPASENKQSELSQISQATQEAFLQRFTHVAQAEQRKYGIPASVILGNGLLLSLAGQRDMALSGNNFFALPCSGDWRGGSGDYQGSCYRHYENAWTSFRDHSLFLTTGKYSHLRSMIDQDYRAWAKALGEAGYGEQEDYTKQLIEVIETLKLTQLDIQ